MPTNNTFIMMGLAMAGLWFMNNRGGSEDDQVDQLAGAAMMASGEGTAPNAPFQAYSAPGNPSFFFNQGGQMTKVPGAAIPFAATSGEDIGSYPGGTNPPELEFEVGRSDPPIGTTDPSPTTPEFAGDGAATFITSTMWENQAAIAAANSMPLLAIQDTAGGGIKILGGDVDISTLSSKEQFRAVSFSDSTGDITGGFTTTGEVLAEYVSGFNAPTPYVARTWQEIEAESGLTARQAAAAGDEDIGTYPATSNPLGLQRIFTDIPSGSGVSGPPELEFTVARGIPGGGTSDISPINPVFAGTAAVNITPATIWDAPATEWFGAFGPSAVDTIKSTVPVLSETAPAWAGGNNWWDEG